MKLYGKCMECVFIRKISSAEAFLAESGLPRIRGEVWRPSKTNQFARENVKKKCGFFTEENKNIKVITLV